MKKYKISGVIGWDATAKDLDAFLAEADGDDIEVTISSPGGLIGEGLDMHNSIRTYPGKKTAILSGYTMSMGSYIPMAFGRENVVAEDNAVMMIHNAQGLTWGDHNEMFKYGNILKGLSAMLGQAYSKATGKSREEIASMMDAETWLFGDEIVNAGFAASSIVRNDGGDDKDGKTAEARLAFASMVAKLGSDKTLFYNDLSRAAMALGQTGAMPIKPKKEETMDLKTLKEKHPDLVAAIASEATAEMEVKLNAAKEEGRADGIKTENSRIKEVRAQLVPGHEELIENLAFDMKTTGPEAAVAVIQAENKLRKDALGALAAGAPPVVPQANGDGQQSMTGEQKIQAEWNKMTVAQKAEFADSFETFAAFKNPGTGVRFK